jgi:hypothetical protein
MLSPTLVVLPTDAVVAYATPGWRRVRLTTSCSDKCLDPAARWVDDDWAVCPAQASEGVHNDVADR